MERVTYFNQPNCIRLSNGAVEVILTTAIGPRVIRYGFIGGDNLLGEVPEPASRPRWGVEAVGRPPSLDRARRHAAQLLAR